MVIDSSALVAILSGEAEALIFAELISNSSYRLVSTLSFIETSIIIGQRYGSPGLTQLDLLIRENSIALVPLSTEQAEIARQAYFNYGKGRHPAKLNLGDCCAYALAKLSKQPLLFKGDDFSKTNIDRVIY
ncbi:MAG: type II toxin-antitoxin system VapC family toxin [Elainellaceae cyanobacterium]